MNKLNKLLNLIILITVSGCTRLGTTTADGYLSLYTAGRDLHDTYKKLVDASFFNLNTFNDGVLENIPIVKVDGTNYKIEMIAAASFQTNTNKSISHLKTAAFSMDTNTGVITVAGSTDDFKAYLEAVYAAKRLFWDVANGNPFTVKGSAVLDAATDTLIENFDPENLNSSSLQTFLAPAVAIAKAKKQEMLSKFKKAGTVDSTGTWIPSPAL